MYFDPETVALLRETLDDAWGCLRPEQQATMQKFALAERENQTLSELEPFLPDEHFDQSMADILAFLGSVKVAAGKGA